ncbi:MULTISPECIES: arylsulfatase [unclassified Minwuia]|jgi:arylsulfatase A-like enzyme|uniref:arylsulfatase n=1 Tax=unclassified Minwuia TaxID=2618799 RepID=UPI002478B3D4|nr:MULTISPECIES: arylsulfatase [unclassified Minwuia]MDF1729911.1 arylsulfatase [Minwuia sp.]
MSYKHPAEPEFGGTIGRTFNESEAWWPEPKLPRGKPNVLLIVLDDTGFSHFGSYGSTIETPNVDRLAANGLRYSSFHTTSLCSPTRACVMTGRNHHTVRMRAISNMDSGFPNMRGAMPRSAATVAEVLRDDGYATFATGKWHLAPMVECSAAGPFHNWPLQRGFNRYYGFMQGETDQFSPEITCDNHLMSPPGTPQDGYHFSEDMVDQAMGMIRDTTSLVPERPFFMYMAFGATHSPHQAPQPYLDKYRGRFDAGWDAAREEWYARQKASGIIPANTKLAPRNRGVEAWDDLSPNQQAFANRLQEAFAGMLDHTDHQIGRMVDFLAEIGRLDDTMIVVMSDNGASQEGQSTGVFDEMRHFNQLHEDVDEAVKHLDLIGGPRSHSNIPWGWAQAGNAPLKWYKQNTHGGGTRDPLIIHWPNALKGQEGQIRRPFAYATDIAATILDVAGVGMPDEVAGVPQIPMTGVSLKDTLTDPDAKPDRDVQYMEMLGHRGIWMDGWKAVTWHRRGKSFDDDRWELYNLDEDFSECDDLAEREPAKLKELTDRWWVEAERHGVLPLDDRGAGMLFRASRLPGTPTARRRYVYYPPVSHIVADACPSPARSFTITATIEHPAGDGDGAILARGTINSGLALYVSGGRVVFDYNCFREHSRIATETPLSPGAHEVVVQVDRNADQSATATLSVDGTVAGTAHIPMLLRIISSTGMDFGRSNAPVTDDYLAPFIYPGRISRVVIQLPEVATAKDREAEVEAEARAAMTRQ